VTHSSEITPTFRAGKLVSLLSIEGLHQIGGSPSVLRMLYRLGVRCATLSHNKGNEYADSAVSISYGGLFPPSTDQRLTCPRSQTAETVHRGLSRKGKEIIAEMNRIGMYVAEKYGVQARTTHAYTICRIADLAHTSHEAQLDALAHSKAPVIFSHSSW